MVVVVVVGNQSLNYIPRYLYLEILTAVHFQDSCYPLLANQAPKHKHALLHHCPPYSAQMLGHNARQVTRAILGRNPPQILEIGARHGTDERIHLSPRIPFGIFVITVISTISILATLSSFTCDLEGPAR